MLINNRYPAFYYILPLIIMLLACSCNSRQKDGLPADGSAMSESAYTSSAEEMLRDSIAKKEEVGNECAAICQRMVYADEMLAAVKSPDALIAAKKEYLAVSVSIEKGFSGISKQEQSVLNTYKANLDRTYADVCREYEIPASGVIANLNNLIRRVDKIHSKSELASFQDVRIGMLRKLDDIYLCVEHNSNKISEIRRLAQILKDKYEDKKQELRVD